MPDRDSNPRIAQLLARLEKDPNSKLFAQLAEEYRQGGFLDAAIQVCEEGLRRNPAFHTARVLLAQCYLESGRLPDARKQLEKVHEAHPDNLKAGKLLASTLIGTGEGGRAALILKNLQRIAPGDREVEQLLAEADSAKPARPPAPPPPVDRPSAGPPPSAATPRAPAAPAPAPPRPSIPAPPAAAQKAPDSGTVMEDAPDEIVEVRRPSRYLEETPDEEPLAPRVRPVTEIPAEMTDSLDLPDIPAEGGPAQPGPVPGDALRVTPSPDLYPEDYRRGMQPSAPDTGEPGGAAIQSPMAAELYAQQGHYDLAIQVYEALRAEGRGTPEIETRLEELRGLLALAPPPAPAPAETFWGAPAAPAGGGWRAPGEFFSGGWGEPAPAPPPSEADARLAAVLRRWLEAIQAARGGLG